MSAIVQVESSVLEIFMSFQQFLFSCESFFFAFNDFAMNDGLYDFASFFVLRFSGDFKDEFHFSSSNAVEDSCEIEESANFFFA